MRLIALVCVLTSCQFFQPAFPKVDRKELTITLRREACYGSCPDYLVTIMGNGRVVFDGAPFIQRNETATVEPIFSTESGVRVTGVHETTISQREIEKLLKIFKQARFFSLRDEYRAPITDISADIVMIDTGNGKKSVLDYGGSEVGMPNAVNALQRAIDAAAATDRWIEGTPPVIPLLKREGADFSGVLGLELMDAAAERGDLQTMRKLKTLRAPLYIARGPSPLKTAIREGHVDAAKWLLAQGAITTQAQWRDALREAVRVDNHGAYELLFQPAKFRWIDRVFATELLSRAALNADPRMVRDMLERGADPDGIDYPPVAVEPPLSKAASGFMAKDHSHSHADRRVVVRQLLDAGADILQCQYGACYSVLRSVDDAQIAKMLLDAGADPNFRDAEGEHILFTISAENVALLLISRGADLKAVRPADGKTLRAWSEYHEWTRVLKRLDHAGL